MYYLLNVDGQLNSFKTKKDLNEELVKMEESESTWGNNIQEQIEAEEIQVIKGELLQLSCKTVVTVTEEK